jgi:uncharacterized lipoprotein YbaY
VEEDDKIAAQKRTTLSGHILIPAATAPIERGAAKVQLEEITAEDAPARVIAEVNLPDIQHRSGVGDTLIPFALSVASEAVDSHKDYALRVWIDHDSDGQRSAGDLYNSERQRVFDSEVNHPLTIRVGR